ncbi:hypothetical protein ACOSQ2_019992 [Xanthoceras sorbifolium]
MQNTILRSFKIWKQYLGLQFASTRSEVQFLRATYLASMPQVSSFSKIVVFGNFPSFILKFLKLVWVIFGLSEKKKIDRGCEIKRVWFQGQCERLIEDVKSKGYGFERDAILGIIPEFVPKNRNMVRKIHDCAYLGVIVRFSFLLRLILSIRQRTGRSNYSKFHKILHLSVVIMECIWRRFQGCSSLGLTMQRSEWILKFYPVYELVLSAMLLNNKLK